MKSLVCLVGLATIFFQLSGCGGKEGVDAKNIQTDVVRTDFPKQEETVASRLERLKVPGEEGLDSVKKARFIRGFGTHFVEVASKNAEVLPVLEKIAASTDEDEKVRAAATEAIEKIKAHQAGGAKTEE